MEFSKGVCDKMCFFVDPSSHILLPLRYRSVRVVWITIRLSVCIYLTALLFLAYIAHTQPPMVNTVITLGEVIVKHGI